jgi:hypothetical protein
MKPFCYHSFDLRQLVSFAEIARAGFVDSTGELLGESKFQKFRDDAAPDGRVN